MTVVHTHIWKPLVKLPGCHSTEWIYQCHCSSIRVVIQEFIPSKTAQDHDEEPCERCEQLLGGSEPVDWDENSEQPKH